VLFWYSLFFLLVLSVDSVATFGCYFFLFDTKHIDMKIILLMLFSAFSIAVYSQSLRDLELLTMSKGKLDSIEIKLKSWDYSLTVVKNKTVDSVNYDTYLFTRPSSDYYIYSTVLVTKNNTDIEKGIFWEITLVTFSDKRFDELRQECIKSANPKYSKEKIMGDTFVRNYKSEFFDYSFKLENAKDKNSPIYYYVKIRCNPANMIMLND